MSIIINKTTYECSSAEYSEAYNDDENTLTEIPIEEKNNLKDYCDFLIIIQLLG